MNKTLQAKHIADDAFLAAVAVESIASEAGKYADEVAALAADAEEES